MQKFDTPWRKNGDWKSRYSKLYSTGRVSSSQEEEPRRISFMSDDSTPYMSLLMRMRANQRDSICDSEDDSSRYLGSTLSQRSEFYNSYRSSIQYSNDLSGNETILLDMVRARNRELEESTDKSLNLPSDMSDDQSSDACIHGLSLRMTERSISRSRVSRVSTRRDMDIPSILAFTTTTPAPTQIELPAFQKLNMPHREEIPRWSVRRSVCPVCSQKWKDRSSIRNVKNSGLKRSSSMDLRTITAPARLKTSITLAYVPRPLLAVVDEDIGMGHGSMRNTSTTWQLTRARRLRMPKPQIPPPEATAPPSATAPLARKDLDVRVHKFLNDEDPATRSYCTPQRDSTFGSQRSGCPCT